LAEIKNKRMGNLINYLKNYPLTFWIANTMELFERWAWYGMFMILALYLTGSTDDGCLGFTQAQKGVMMGTSVAILYFLPLLMGSIADKFGYKNRQFFDEALLCRYLADNQQIP